jgi:hypothetical protein
MEPHREGHFDLTGWTTQFVSQKCTNHWTTAYGSQSYDNWEEVPIPVGALTPGLMFVQETFSSCQAQPRSTKLFGTFLAQ